MGRFKFTAGEGLILCKAQLTNRKRSAFVKLVVDTCASITMVSVETALVIGIDPSKSMHRLEITTAGGIVLAPIIKIPSFKCFGVEIKNMEVVCHNLPSQSPVEGLLGLNFLRNAKIIIDFSKNIIILPESV